MSLKKTLIPAALLALIALLAPRANAQTMGEYAGVTAGAASGSSSIGSIGTGFSLPMPSIGAGDNGASSGTWGASKLGGTFEDRAGAASGLGQDFESRAGASTDRFGAQSRWPGTAFSNDQGSRLDGTSDRFSTGDRFTQNDRFSSQSRFPGTSFSDRSGLDTNYNAVNGY